MPKKKIEKEESTNVDTKFANQYFGLKEKDGKLKPVDEKWNPEDDSWDDDYDEGGDDDNE